MIPDEMLREAIARTYESYISHLLSDYDPEYRCEFSPIFEKKIKKLMRRADHPILYHTLKRIAVILLTLLIAGTVWISVDAGARAAFFGWISEITGYYFEYHHDGVRESIDETANYRPTWIPTGYSEDSVRVFDDKTTVRYKNDQGELLRFSYVNTDANIDWFFDVSQGDTQSCRVGEYMATFFAPADNNTASAITWVDSNNTAFYLTGFVSETELIRIAESVKITEK